MVLDSNYTTIHEWEWQSCYLLRVAGLGSARVRRLNLPYKERVYTCDLLEGEGWWARMVFAVSTRAVI